MFDTFFHKIYYKILRRDPESMYRKYGCTIGKNFSITGGVIVDYSHCWLVEIGDDVTLAPRVHILAHDASTKVLLGYTRIGRVTIGNRVFVGAGAIILPGVTIGDDVVIGAGSVVSRDIPSNSIAAGSPVKVLCGMDEFLQKKREEMKVVPFYDEGYTLEGDITDEKKRQMKEDLANSAGYII